MRNERLVKQLEAVRRELREHLQGNMDDEQFKACYQAWAACKKAEELLEEKVQQLPLPLDDFIRNTRDSTASSPPILGVQEGVS